MARGCSVVVGVAGSRSLSMDAPLFVESDSVRNDGVDAHTLPYKCPGLCGLVGFCALFRGYACCLALCATRKDTRVQPEEVEGGIISPTKSVAPASSQECLASVLQAASARF